MKKICLALIVSALLPLSAAHAQSAIETRVHIAAHQSALGHRLVRAMCFVKAGIEVSSNTEVIAETRAEIEEGIVTMMDGGGQYNLSPEDDWTTRTMYKGLKNAWKNLRAGTDAFAENGDMHTDDLYDLSVRATSVEKMWTNILKRSERRLANPDDNTRQNLVRLAHAAGAQEAYLQEAGKLACMLHLDQGHIMSTQSRAELKAAVNGFDEAAFALTFSSAKLGLIAPPTDLLQNENFLYWQKWASIYQVFLDFGHIHTATEEDQKALRNLSYDIDTLAHSLTITSEHYKDYLVAQAFSSVGFNFDG